MMKAFASWQFALFLITGGTAATINFLSRILFNQWLNYSSAIILAYIVGMITAFILARLFVFKQSNQNWHRSALLFALVNVAAVAQTWVISMVLAYYVLPNAGITNFVPELAHAAGVVFPVFTSYLGHKYWSFR